MRKLIFFTVKFPFKGGEPFIETEINYLSKAFDQVIIYPLEGFENELLPLPENVIVKHFDINQPVYLRNLLIKHGWVIVKWFVLEFIKSPYRFKYISQFKWNFKRLVGLLNNAVEFKKELDFNYNNHDTTFYSYWFNEWVSILSLANELGFKKEFVTRVHMYDFQEEYYVRKYLPFRRTEMHFPSSIYAISEFANNYISKQFPKYKAKLEVNKLGVEDFGNNLISKDNYFTIVSCSNINWYKRPFKLIELISRISLPIKWIHFGDGVMREEFFKKAKNLPINVEFIWKGHVSNKEVTEFYKKNSIDLIINVSSFEGIPVSLMEAISFGIPIVGCNLCGMPEIVNSNTGLLLEKEFNEEIAAKEIEEFLQSKSRNLEFRNGVKNFWKSDFNASKNYKEFVEIL